VEEASHNTIKKKGEVVVVFCFVFCFLFLDEERIRVEIK